MQTLPGLEPKCKGNSTNKHTGWCTNKPTSPVNKHTHTPGGIKGAQETPHVTDSDVELAEMAKNGQIRPNQAKLPNSTNTWK